MTVKELLVLLQNKDPDMIVVLNMGLNERANGRTVHVVEEVKAYKFKDSSTYYQNYYDDEEPVGEKPRFLQNATECSVVNIGTV